MTDRSTDHWRGRHYDADHITGPVGFLNPTTRLLSVHRPKGHAGGAGGTGGAASAAPATPTEDGVTNGAPAPPPPGDAAKGPGSPALEERAPSSHTGAYALWRSRDNRKGRHALVLTPSAAEGRTGIAAPAAGYSNTLAATLSGVGRMVLRYPVWDVSYDVAVVFTLGSVVWVLNGFFLLLPITNPAGSFSGESEWGGGVSAVVGATIFEVGSVLLMIEAVNENRSECFGLALKAEFEHSEENLLKLTWDKSACRHHHAEKSSWLSRKGHAIPADAKDDSGGDGPIATAGEEDVGAIDPAKRKWTWWPSWYELRTHYFRDIGFLACFSQMFGATVFWISGFTGLPQILNVLSVPAANGIYWLPQVIGGTGFIVSSWLFMLETQKRWYIPAPTVLGWHIGFWNLIGALGFTLCGALGFASSNEACEIALTWSTFIGSWAFLIGSVVQWYESLDKYPIVKANVPAKTTSE